MKTAKYPVLCILVIGLSVACSAGRPEIPQLPDTAADSISPENTAMIQLLINGSRFDIEPESSDAADALIEMLPMTLPMTELNGNEKFYNLGARLPAAPVPAGNISSGDLMLWGEECLVLFYKSFQTAYSYTRIGSMKNADGLFEAVGDGDVTITFSKK